MAKVIVTCGKICAGKSTYAEKICNENNGLIFSVDEIMLTVFGQDAGERHDEYVEKIKKYLLEKSCKAVFQGIDIVLDWGLWTAVERKNIREFYQRHGIECEIHYIEICDKTWKERIEKRNRLVTEGETDAYYIDEMLAKKLDSVFEEPEKHEIDVWVNGE